MTSQSCCGQGAWAGPESASACPPFPSVPTPPSSKPACRSTLASLGGGFGENFLFSFFLGGRGGGDCCCWVWSRSHHRLLSFFVFPHSHAASPLTPDKHISVFNVSR